MIKQFVKHIPLLVTILFIGCKQDNIELEPEKTPDQKEVVVVVDTGTTGEIDLSNYIAVGNSLTSGYQNGALYDEGQANSLPLILNKSFAKSGGVETFVQPLIGSENGVRNLSGVAKGEAPLGRLILTSFDGGSPVPAPIGPGNYPFAELSDDVKSKNQNMGIPGIRVVDVAVAGYARLNPYFGRITLTPESTYIDEVKSKKASFVTIWMGGNDVLGYATEGASSLDAAVAGPTAYLQTNTLTDVPTFTTAYSNMLNEIFIQEQSDGVPNTVKGVIANIPDISTIPFFTTLPYNSIPLEQAQVNLLNTNFKSYNDALEGIASALEALSTASRDQSLLDLLPSESVASRKVNYIAGQNAILVADESLPTITAAIDAIEVTVAGLKQEIDGGLTSLEAAKTGANQWKRLEEASVAIDNLIALEEEVIPALDLLAPLVQLQTRLAALVTLDQQIAALEANNNRTQQDENNLTQLQNTRSTNADQLGQALVNANIIPDKTLLNTPAGVEQVKIGLDSQISTAESLFGPGLIRANIISDASELSDPAAVKLKVEGAVTAGKSQLATGLIAGGIISNASELDNLNIVKSKVNLAGQGAKTQIGNGLLAGGVITSIDELTDATTTIAIIDRTIDKVNTQKTTLEAQEAQLQPLLASKESLRPFNQARPATAEDLITLTAGTQLGTTVNGDATKIIGVSVPLGDAFTLLKEEKNFIQERINDLNAAIIASVKQLGLEDRIAMVDMKAKLKELKEGQTDPSKLSASTKSYLDGLIYTSDFVPPTGLFSVDGVHLNSRGYALSANFFMEAIDAKFNSKLPRATLGLYKTNEAPVSK